MEINPDRNLIDLVSVGRWFFFLPVDWCPTFLMMVEHWHFLVCVRVQNRQWKLLMKSEILLMSSSRTWLIVIHLHTKRQSDRYQKLSVLLEESKRSFFCRTVEAVFPFHFRRRFWYRLVKVFDRGLPRT